MADVTFGVKVSEEMKNELSELMKNTELSGKEFMNMLISSYKLEKSKKEKSSFTEDINELQRLLNRIQGMYINIGEKAEFIIEDRLEDINQEVVKKEESITSLKKQLEVIGCELENKHKEIDKLALQVATVSKEKENIVKNLDEAKAQLKNNQLLYTKYESEIEQLKNQISLYGRLELEIEERNEENQKLKNRNDELASDIWFIQRELDKLRETKSVEVSKLEEEIEKIKAQSELELKNQLLEQKLAFNSKLELLKEENFKIQQECARKIQEYLEKSLEKEQENLK